MLAGGVRVITDESERTLNLPSSASPAPRVAVVILNWNGKADTLECLESLMRMTYRDFEAVVVDNGSSDGSAEAIGAEYPHVTLLQTGVNLGYAGGNNAGVRWVMEKEFDYVLILNNDTIVSENLLGELVRTANILPPRSVLGASIYYYDQPDRLWFAGGRWVPGSSRFQHVVQESTESSAHRVPKEVDYVTGCALFAGLDAFRDVGLLDERFFLTYEETDWCFRAREKGYRCVIVPSAKLWHKVSASFGGTSSPLIDYFMTRNKLLWGKRHLKLGAQCKLHVDTWRHARRSVLPPLHLAGADGSVLRRLVWSVTTWLRDLKRNLASPRNRALLLGLRDYYLRRFGNCPDAVRQLSSVRGSRP
jgi:hypothetical protein